MIKLAKMAVFGDKQTLKNLLFWQIFCKINNYDGKRFEIFTDDLDTIY
jgi:hypothetical protein